MCYGTSFVCYRYGRDQAVLGLVGVMGDGLRALWSTRPYGPSMAVRSYRSGLRV